eukprot:7391423-Prymnesium_polylepis.2
MVARPQAGCCSSVRSRSKRVFSWRFSLASYSLACMFLSSQCGGACSKIEAAAPAFRVDPRGSHECAPAGRRMGR